MYSIRLAKLSEKGDIGDEDSELNMEFQFEGKIISLQDITSKIIFDILLNMRTEKSQAIQKLEQMYDI